MNNELTNYYKFRGDYKNTVFPWLKFLEKEHENACVIKDKGGRSITYYDKPQLQKRAKVFKRKKETLDYKEGTVLHYDSGKDYYYLYKKQTKKGANKQYSITQKPGYEKSYFTKIPKTEEHYMVDATPAIKAGLYIHDSVNDMIKECTKRKKRYSIAVMRIVGAKKMRHANAIIYDNVKKTLTRFEPHGASSSRYDWVTLDEEFDRYVNKHRDIFSSYNRPIDYCPRVGPQTKEQYALYAKRGYTRLSSGKSVFVRQEAGGFCAAFSLMFLHYKLSYPDKTDSEISDMMNKEPDMIAKDIRSYMATIVNTIEKM